MKYKIILLYDFWVMVPKPFEVIGKSWFGQILEHIKQTKINIYIRFFSLMF